MGIPAFIKTAGVATKAFAKSPVGKAAAKRVAVRFGVITGVNFAIGYLTSVSDGYIYGDDSYHLRDKIGGVSAHYSGVRGVGGYSYKDADEKYVNHRVACIFDGEFGYSNRERRMINIKSAAIIALVQAPSSLALSISEEVIKLRHYTGVKKLGVWSASFAASYYYDAKISSSTRKRIGRIVDQVFSEVNYLGDLAYAPHEGDWRFSSEVEDQLRKNYEDELRNSKSV